jgi:hypothetical protein
MRIKGCALCFCLDLLKIIKRVGCRLVDGDLGIPRLRVRVCSELKIFNQSKRSEQSDGRRLRRRKVGDISGLQAESEPNRSRPKQNKQRTTTYVKENVLTVVSSVNIVW